VEWHTHTYTRTHVHPYTVYLSAAVCTLIICLWIKATLIDVNGAIDRG
jgi:hypothetical protein